MLLLRMPPTITTGLPPALIPWSLIPRVVQAVTNDFFSYHTRISVVPTSREINCRVGINAGNLLRGTATAESYDSQSRLRRLLIHIRQIELTETYTFGILLFNSGRLSVVRFSVKRFLSNNSRCPWNIPKRGRLGPTTL